MSILLCSADAAVRERWQDLIGNRDVLQAQTLAELRRHAPANDIDLILLHRSIVNREEFSAVRNECPGSKFFLFSDRPDEEEGLAFLKQGIVGYANTYISPPRFAEAVKVVLSGAVWIGQKVMQRLIQETRAVAVKESSATVDHKKLESLTPREREIAELVSKGQSNLEIAYELNISERTVKAHLSSIYAKTDTGSRLNLALLFNRGSAG